MIKFLFVYHGGNEVADGDKATVTKAWGDWL